MTELIAAWVQRWLAQSSDDLLLAAGFVAVLSLQLLFIARAAEKAPDSSWPELLGDVARVWHMALGLLVLLFDTVVLVVLLWRFIH